MMFWLDSVLEIVGCHSNTVTRVGGREIISLLLKSVHPQISEHYGLQHSAPLVFWGGTMIWCICQCLLVITLWLLSYQTSHNLLHHSSPLYSYYGSLSRGSGKFMTDIINIISLTKSHEKNQKSIFRYFRHSYIVTLYWSLPVTNWTTRFCLGNTLFLHKHLTDRKYIIQSWLISFGHFLFLLEGRIKTSGNHMKASQIWEPLHSRTCQFHLSLM